LILLDLALYLLSIFGLRGALYNFFVLHTLPFGKLSLVGLAVDIIIIIMTDFALSFSAMTLLIGSSDP